MLLRLALSDRANRPAIVYCGTRRDVAELTERRPSAGPAGARLSRGPARGGARLGPAPLQGGRHRDRARHHRAWGWASPRPPSVPSCPGLSPRAARRTTRRVGAGGATATQPARSCWPVASTWAGGSTSSRAPGSSGARPGRAVAGHVRPGPVLRRPRGGVQLPGGARLRRACVPRGRGAQLGLGRGRRRTLLDHFADRPPGGPPRGVLPHVRSRHDRAA